MCYDQCQGIVWTNELTMYMTNLRSIRLVFEVRYESSAVTGRGVKNTETPTRFKSLDVNSQSWTSNDLCHFQIYAVVRLTVSRQSRVDALPPCGRSGR